MKIKNFGLIVLLAFALFQCPAFGQLIELDIEQNITVSAPGFYPFSDSANETIKQLLVENKSVAIVITNFDGTKLKVAPAVDGRETGRKKIVRDNRIIKIS